MKPDFALNLSHEGISLLHRGTAGWLKVGEVALDASNLLDRLKMLRRNAADLAGGGLATKLILPNSQVLYTELDAPGPDTAARLAQIRDGLASLTPYEVDDLVYDWRARGTRVQVAVVARETLAEAEAFAAEHRFNPVSFTAIAEPTDFDGEPFFGATTLAASLLDPADQVEPDVVPMRVIETGRKRKAPRRRTPKPAEAAAPVPASDSPQPPPPAPGAALPEAVVATTPRAPASSGPAPDRAIPGGAVAALPDRVTARFAPDPGPEQEVLQSRQSRTPMPVTAPQTADTGGDEAARRRQRARDTAMAARAALQSVERAGRERAALPHPPAAPAHDADGELTIRPAPKRAAPAPVIIPAAGARTEAEALTVFGERGRVADARELPRFAVPALATAALATLGVAAVWSAYMLSDAATGWFQTADVGVPAIGAAEVAAPATRPVADAVLPPERTLAALSPAGPDDPRAVAIDRATPGEPPRPPEASAADPVIGAPSQQATGITHPTGEAPAPVTDTAPTVVALAASERPAGDTRSAPVPVVREGAPDLPDNGAQTSVLTDLADASAGIDPTVAGRRVASLNAPGQAADSLPGIDVLLPPAPRRTATGGQGVEDAAVRYAATGIWVADPQPTAAPPSDRNEDLYIASIDPVIAPEDALALPAAPNQTDDLRPAAPTPPAPHGTRFTLDDRGLVVATADGALSPEGVLIVAGKPPLAPGPRPERVAAVVAEAGWVLDPRLRDIRPKLRPSTLQETNQRARLGGRTSAELEVIRPTLRPVSQQAAAEVAAEPTALAIATSANPRIRPNSIDRVVRASLRAPTTATPKPAVGTTRGTAVTPRAAEPRLPTRSAGGAVARQATVSNAVNLGRINLIGVYGSESERRALVRLPTGRYVKVKVGDRVDGGRVASIGDSELRYVKGGRNYTLKLPRT